MLNELVRFCHRLREYGVENGPGHVAAGAQALHLVQLTDREQVFNALQITLCRKVEDFGLFAMLFDEVWRGRLFQTRPDDSPDADHRPGPASDQNSGPGNQPQFTEQSDSEGGDETGEESAASYSAQILLRRDVSTLQPDEIPEFERLAKKLAKRFAMRLSLRLRRGRRGAVDPGRTLRRALQQGGEVLQIRRRKKRREKVRLVSLLDVSGSMQPYARLLLIFLTALATRVTDMETYVFSTGLSRVTRELKDGDWERAMRAAPDWGGGTRIGESIAAFVRGESGERVDRHTVLVVLSDGLDTGEIDLLRRAMERLERKAGRIIWLNPLARDEAYQPLARGMHAALPFLDTLASAHNLESMLKLETYI